MRHTKGHTGNRRSHHALKGARFETCQKCNAKHLMHRACGNCGEYRGRVVVDVMKKVLKTAKKAEARKGHSHETAHPEKVPALKGEESAKAGKKTKKETVGE